jgi:hypothetical protein
MNDKELEAFEEQLRRFQPQAPPTHLRTRALARKDRLTRSRLILRVAAVIFLFVTVICNSMLDALSYTPTDSLTRAPLSEFQAYGKLGTLDAGMRFAYRVQRGLIGALKENVNMEVIH